MFSEFLSDFLPLIKNYDGIYIINLNLNSLSIFYGGIQEYEKGKVKKSIVFCINGIYFDILLCCTNCAAYGRCGQAFL